MGQLGRRGFLALLGAALATAGVAELDADKLLWAPGAKKLFLPPIGGWKQADIDSAWRAQAALNRVNSMLMDAAAPVHDFNEIAKRVLTAFNERRAAAKVDDYGCTRGLGEWVKGDNLQFALTPTLDTPLHREILTAPIEAIGYRLKITEPLSRGTCEMIGHRLADKAMEEGLTAFVEPALFRGSEICTRMANESGAVRVTKCQTYDGEYGEHMVPVLAFDVLGAKMGKKRT